MTKYSPISLEMIPPSNDVPSEGEALLWLDYETTGLPDLDSAGYLGSQKHRILEVSWVITDFQLNILSKIQTRVIQHKKEDYVHLMVPFVEKMHTDNKLIDDVEISKNTLAGVESEILSDITEVVGKYYPSQSFQKIKLAGSTIWFDRSFCVAQMPRLNKRLFHRVHDVSDHFDAAVRYAMMPTPERSAPAHRTLSDVTFSLTQANHIKDYLASLGALETFGVLSAWTKYSDDIVDAVKPLKDKP